MTTAEQAQITIGSKVRHIRKGWTATVTSIYASPGYRTGTAGLQHEVGTSCCSLHCLELAD